MSKEDWKINTLDRIFKEKNLWPWADGEIVSILDVACGLSLKSKYLPAQVRVGVDIYEPYFKSIEANVPFVIIRHDVRNLKDIFVDKSFDLVIALDIVEHLEKNEALEMMRQCENIARKGVIIETPEGYIPQNLDILGHGGHEWQTHRSGWDVNDFEDRGYQVILRDYKMSDVKRHTEIEVAPDIKLIDAIKTF